MDLFDKKILLELQKNATISHKKIGKNIKRSTDFVSYRVKQLEQSGVIKKYGAIVARQQFNFTDAYILISVRSLNKKEKDELIEYLQQSSQTKWINEVFGDYSFYCVITGKYFSEIVSFITNLERNFSTSILDTTLLPVVQFVSWSPYLSSSKSFVIKNVGAITYSCDNLDVNLLTEYSENARISNVALANKYDVSQKTIIQRKKKLVQSNILIGSYCSLDLHKLNLLNYIVFYSIKITKELESRLAELGMMKEITFIDIIQGKWTLRVDFTTSSIQEFEEAMNSFESHLEFPIRSRVILQNFKEHKRTSFPEIMQSF